MKTYLECVPCFLQMALKNVRQFTNDENKQEQLMREVLVEMSNMDLSLSPPEIGHRIFGLINNICGDSDPYLEDKRRFNKFALELLPDLRKKVKESNNPFEMAVRLSIAGNIIDLAANADINENDVIHTIDDCITAKLYSDEDLLSLEADVKNSDRVMILGDNAGEIVFDQLLIEQIPDGRVIYVVKGSPVVNDATIADAEETGLTKLANVIDNGSSAPGTILDDCSEGFVEKFNKADLVISKGQANYETLSDVNKNIFFVLKVKCPIIADDLGYEVGNCIIKKNNHNMD